VPAGAIASDCKYFGAKSAPLDHASVCPMIILVKIIPIEYCSQRPPRKPAMDDSALDVDGDSPRNSAPTKPSAGSVACAAIGSLTMRIWKMQAAILSQPKQQR